ncbi:MAG: phage holin family protein [Burkholderiales bacterium]|nr:phage holin family protein [Burkholderiales bacterium]
MSLILRWLINVLALLALPYVFRWVSVDNLWTALIVAVVLGLLNTVLRPILLLLTLPITLLTLGLFAWIINGLMFWLAAQFVTGFSVTGFWAAVFGALLYSLVTALANKLLLPKD